MFFDSPSFPKKQEEIIRKEEEERKLVRMAVGELSPRERVIIEMRYGLGGQQEFTQKEVADILGISQSYISRLEKKIMQVLRRKIQDKMHQRNQGLYCMSQTLSAQRFREGRN